MPIDLFDVPRPNERHVRLQFISQKLYHAPDSVLAIITTHAVQDWSSNTDCCGSQSQSLDDVGASSYPTIYEDLHVLADNMRSIFVDL